MSESNLTEQGALSLEERFNKLKEMYLGDIEANISEITEARSEFIEDFHLVNDPESDDYPLREYDDQIAHWKATREIVEKL